MPDRPTLRGKTLTPDGFRHNERKVPGEIRRKMLVRVGTAEVGPEHLDELLRRYRETVRPIHERCAGLRDHYVLVDKQSGRVMVIGVWESLEALEAAAPLLEPARERLWDDFPETPALQAYEVGDAFRAPAIDACE